MKFVFQLFAINEKRKHKFTIKLFTYSPRQLSKNPHTKMCARTHKQISVR